MDIMDTSVMFMSDKICKASIIIKPQEVKGLKPLEAERKIGTVQTKYDSHV